MQKRGRWRFCQRPRFVSFHCARLVLEQVLDKADAVVFEDDLAAVLRGVQIDIAHDAKIVGAILVGKDLVHVPYVRGLLVGLVNGKHRGAAGISVGEDFLVLLVVSVECFLPADLAHAPVVVELAQVANVLAGGKGHAAEERVAHQ